MKATLVSIITALIRGQSCKIGSKLLSFMDLLFHMAPKVEIMHLRY